MSLGVIIKTTPSRQLAFYYQPTIKPLTIPNHKEIAKGTLKAIIDASGVDPRDFTT